MKIKEEKFPFPYPIDEDSLATTEEGSYFEDHSFAVELKTLALEHKLYVALLVYKGIRKHWAIFTHENVEIFKTHNREDVEKYLKMLETENEKNRKDAKGFRVLK